MMSQSRFAASYAGLNSMARKAYEAVPISQSWTIPQIIKELGRTGVSVEYRVLAGCLGRMQELGMVTEQPRGYFIRAAIREPAKPSPEPFNPPRITMPTPTPATSDRPIIIPSAPLDRLGDIATRVGQIALLTKTLADDMATVAIEVQEQFEAAHADNAKLKQLQSILKSLGV